MNISLKIFASLKEKCGFSDRNLTVDDNSSINSILSGLAEEFPELSVLSPSLFTAVNGEYKTGETILKNNDILAIFPPVSGG